jgi:3-methyladenine DNA glycosylase AlkC
MSSLLKDLYSPAFYDRISDLFAEVIPAFNKKSFITQIFTPNFESKELKERMRHTSTVLHGFFPSAYPETVKLIKKMISTFRERGIGEDGLAYMFLPDYIEVYGIDNYAISVKALEMITQFVSCELAIRPFLLKYGEAMIKEMQSWSGHKNYKVRRLASEGSRPRLPWGMAVPALKKDPNLILPILENLKNDPSEWVRRSVANSLNDIAKDHPAIVLQIAKKWAGLSKETDAIIKHGSRTLLKQGHIEILKQVFKISEKQFQPNIEATVHRKQKFVLITTRKFYVGAHRLSIIINGEEKINSAFELTG